MACPIRGGCWGRAGALWDVWYNDCFFESRGVLEGCELLKGRYGLKVREMLKHILDFLGTRPH